MIKLKKILPKKLKYFYHATTANALPPIFKNGLTPSKKSNWEDDILIKASLGKIFMTTEFEDAVQYGNDGIWIKLHEYQNKFRPVLRFKYDSNKLINDIQNDYYSKLPIKANFEVFIPSEDTEGLYGTNEFRSVFYEENKGKWKPLTKNIVDNIYNSDMSKSKATSKNLNKRAINND